MDKTQAQAALDAVASTRRELLPITECPPWRHAAFGGVMGALILSQGLPQPWQSALFVASMASVALIARDDRRRYGVFVNGYRRGKTLGISLALLAVMLVLIVIQIRVRFHGGPAWAPFAVAAVAFAIGTVTSIYWNRVFRRTLLGERG